MKKLLLVLILGSIQIGCASNQQKATQYCDTNWKGRFESWQSCYDRIYQANENATNRGAHLFNTQHNKTINCTTWGNQTDCH